MSDMPLTKSLERTGSTEAHYRVCPQCQAPIPIDAGFETWCDKCGWNLEIPELPQRLGLFDKLYISISQRYSQRLFEEMLETDSLRPKYNPAKFLAILIAGCIHSITLAWAILGVWLFALPSSRALGILLSLPCFVMIWLLLPRLPKSRGTPLSRTAYPAMYRLADRIASTLHSPTVDCICCDMLFNAAFGQHGWLQKRRLMLGIPLLSILNGQEFVALFSHEIAHGINGDPTRNLFLRSAMYSLAAWYELIHPQNRWHIFVGPAQILLFIFNLISWPIAGLIWLSGYGLSHLLWYDNQRAEYLADMLAAQMSGTQAQLTTLDKAQLREMFLHRLKFAYIDRKGQSFFGEFKKRVALVPAREFERLRRIDQFTLIRFGSGHPPSAFRVRFLEAHPSQAIIVLSAEEVEMLEKEVASLIEAAQQFAFALDEITFREYFGVSW
jgi:heat shock protein HtpX